MKKRAFSLLELAVVLLVISLITAGIMKGLSIVKTSRLTAAKSLTTNSKINEIEGMIAWFEPTMNESFEADETIDNSPISIWHDISPESIGSTRNSLTKAILNDDVVYRSLGINSLPSLQFTQAGTLTLASFFQGSFNKFTIFTVFAPTVTLGSTYLTVLDAYSGATSNYAVAFNSSNLKITTLSSDTISKSFTQSNPYAICVYFNGADSKAFVNAAETATANFTADNTSLYGLTVGTDEIIANQFTGLISEIIIFNRIISDKERKSIMSYLGQKYKIEILAAS